MIAGQLEAVYWDTAKMLATGQGGSEFCFIYLEIQYFIVFQHHSLVIVQHHNLVIIQTGKKNNLGLQKSSRR